LKLSNIPLEKYPGRGRVDQEVRRPASKGEVLLPSRVKEV